MNEFPQWFINLTGIPEMTRAAFAAAVSSKSFISDAACVELIEIFGRINQNQISSFLPNSFKGVYQNRLREQAARFQAILDISLNALSHNKCLNIDKLASYYQLSAFSSENIQECVLREIVNYLQSLPMPAQESMMSGCHDVKVIKANMDKHQKELEEAANAVFQMTLGNQMAPLQRLTLRQEQLIFKCAALKGHGKMISWGRLLFFWLQASPKGAKIAGEMHSSFHFDKILIADGHRLLSPATLPDISFQDFVTEQTLDFLLSNPHPLFPLEMLTERLREFIAGSVRAQQDLVYAVDYCHRFPRDDEFPLDEALRKLNSMILGRDSKHIIFLCKWLYYLFCQSKLRDHEHEQSLFNDIMDVACEKPIVEAFSRDPLASPQLFEFMQTRNMPMGEFARIGLKYACTMQKPNDRAACPYLNSLQHLHVLEKMEVLGLRPPLRPLLDLLLFQTATQRTLNAIDDFILIRSKILGEWLDSIAIPLDLYMEWEKKAGEFITSIQSNPKEQFPHYISERLPTYQHKMMQLARYLQFTVYPQPFTSISSLMPAAIEGTTLKFNAEGTRQIDCLTPLMEDFTTDTGQLRQWKFDPQSRQHSFSVTLIDSMTAPRVSCTFRVPLDIPDSEDIQNAFFLLCASAADALGRETLTEEEAGILYDRGINQFYLVPTELLRMQDHTSNQFDALMQCSPFLIARWDELSPAFGEEASKIKVGLLRFIKTYRSCFKKAFYTVLNPQRASEILSHSEIEAQAFKLIHLGATFKEKSEVFSHADSVFIFEQIYQQMLHQETIECTLQIEEGASKGNLSIRIERNSCAQENSAISTYQISMELQNETERKQLLVKYESFVDEVQFAQLMVWQKELLSVS